MVKDVNPFFYLKVIWIQIQDFILEMIKRLIIHMFREMKVEQNPILNQARVYNLQYLDRDLVQLTLKIIVKFIYKIKN